MFINYKHFNMLSINNAFKIIGPYEYMTATDLTDAFFFLYLYILLIKNIKNLHFITNVNYFMHVKWIWNCYKVSLY